MRLPEFAVVLGICVASAANADEKPRGPLSPADVAKLREAAIQSLKEDIRSFDPAAASAEQIDRRWVVRAGREILKDFGTDKGAAQEAVRLIHDLGVNQLGTVAGSKPEFEYWLRDGKVPRAINSRVVVVPVNARTLRAESVGGTWMVSDGLKGLYDFGTNADAAKRAAVVFWKYGFNQVGVVGSPQPAMLYPLHDPRQAPQDKSGAGQDPSPLGVLSDASRTSLLLPGNVYAGPKAAFDVKKLEIARGDREWVLLHNGDVIGKFGAAETTARSALRTLQDAHATELARIGECGFPLFLADGRPLHAEPLGVTRLPLRPDRLKVQKVRDSFWLFEDNRQVLEVGKQADAEVLLRVIRFYELKAVCLFGRPEAGGLRVLSAGR